MRPSILWTVVALSCAPPALAQPASRWYAGARLVSNTVSADNVDTGAIGAAGGMLGVRLSPSISVELGVDYGFGTLSRSYEGIGISFAPPNSSREEIERLGVYQRFDRDWTPKAGFSGLVVWRYPTRRRVSAALFGGVSGTWYRERYQTTSLRIPAEIDPGARSLQPSLEEYTRNRGGLAGGVMVPIALTRDISVAPEMRYLYGSLGDEIYNVFTAGARMLWRF